MRPAIMLVALATCAMAGCDTSPFARSCGGELVELCGPAEWANISEASLSPERLTVADFSLRAQVRVVLERCEGAPAPHEVDLLVVVPHDPSPDAGLPVRVMNLVTLEDGADGDPVAGDGIIDVDIANPFIATVPTEEDVTLRFVARSTTVGGCGSGIAEIPYRTGPMR